MADHDAGLDIVIGPEPARTVKDNHGGPHVEDPARFVALKLRLRRENGGAVYINGEEVVRDGIPRNAGHRTLAATVNRGVSRYVHYVYMADPTVLRSGYNTIAVQVHQNPSASSDMAFDLELQALAEERSPSL